MSTRHKNTSKTVKRASELASRAGLVLMSAAVTIGMMELPDHVTSHIVVPNQPVFAWANENGGELNTLNTLRRENEEAEQHYVSYSVAQRTPSRSKHL